jgi:iron(III) transport system substrate-binding protein
MNSRKLYWGLSVTCGILMAASLEARAASKEAIDRLVAGAKKEGEINFHAPSAIGPKAAQLLGAAFNKKYGLNVKLNYFSSSSFTKDTAKAIGWGAVGVPPDWDLMVLTENNHADLWQRKLHHIFDYKSLGIDNQSIQHDGGTLALSHGLVLPAYNTKVVQSKDVPRSWEALLDPKWKDGKLGVSDATYYFALFTKAWGEQKTTEYVKSLAKQRPFLGRLAELTTRLQLGEILIATINMDPILVSTTNIGVLKGAAHPNAAVLFTAFNLSPEGQDLWEQYRGHTSAFIPGTRTYNFLKGKKVVFMEGQDPALVERLANEYSRIFGFATQ